MTQSFYRLFDLVLSSAIALPELVAWPATEGCDVDIRFGSVAPLPGRSIAGLRIGSEGPVLEVPGVGRYLITEGRSVVIDAAPDAGEANIRLFLLGSAMSVVLLQRGILPLHANAVVVGGSAFAFLGPSGAGKSTLALAFHDRGYLVLADDVCAIATGPAGFSVTPGVPRIRLWRDAIERTGRAVRNYEQAFAGVDKYSFGAAPGAPTAAYPLRGIFSLHDKPAISIKPLSGQAAVALAVANTYRGQFLSLVGNRASHFESCVNLAKKVPVFSFYRPRDAERINEAVDFVETFITCGNLSSGSDG